MGFDYHCFFLGGGAFFVFLITSQSTIAVLWKKSVISGADVFLIHKTIRTSVIETKNHLICCIWIGNFILSAHLLFGISKWFSVETNHRLPSINNFKPNYFTLFSQITNEINKITKSNWGFVQNDSWPVCLRGYLFAVSVKNSSQSTAKVPLLYSSQYFILLRKITFKYFPCSVKFFQQYNHFSFILYIFIRLSHNIIFTIVVYDRIFRQTYSSLFSCSQSPGVVLNPFSWSFYVFSKNFHNFVK